MANTNTYIGSIDLWALDWAPEGWIKCDGQYLSTDLYQALHLVIGNTYGSKQNYFAVPDLCGRVPIGPVDGGHKLGEKTGSNESTTIQLAQMPTHAHTVDIGLKLWSCKEATTNTITDHGFASAELPSASKFNSMHDCQMGETSFSITVKSNGTTVDPINQMQPYLCLNYCICYNGIYPSSDEVANSVPDAEDYMTSMMLWPSSEIPDHWHVCDGALLKMAEYPVLYSLLGNKFGGDGMTTFALPNVQGSVAVGIGTLERDLFSLGKTGGKTSVALTEKNLPLHTHTVGFSYKILAKDSEATQGSAKGHYPAYFEQYGYPYHKTANCKTTAFSYTATVQPSGSKEVEKISLLQPYVCLHYIICLEGLYPSRSIKQPEETPMHAIHESNNEQRKEE